MSPTDEALDATPPLVPPPSLAGGPADAGAVRRGWLVPAIIGSALMMQMLSATVIVSAIPAMARSFHVDPLRLNVAITVYLMAAAICLPVSGWLADRFGARRVFMCSIVIYALASAACGLANNTGQLMAARFLQGAAGATLMPVGRLVLLRTTPRNELVGALSVLTMPAMLGPMIGPVLGGAIITFADWRWVFFINLPIAVAGLFLVYRHVPEVKEQNPPPVDVKGALLTGGGLAAMIFGFENIGRGELSPWEVAGLFLLGLSAFGVYVWHARRTTNAVVDLAVFRKRTFRASVIGGSFMRVIMTANPFLLAMLLQVAFGLSAFTAGLMTFLSGAAALAMKTTAPPILRRFGFRRVLVVNAVLTSCSLMAMSLFRPDWPAWAIAMVLCIGGFCRSLQFTSMNSLAFAEIGQDQMSRATTSSSMVQQLVQSIGIGMAASLVHMLMLIEGETRLTVPVIAPAFLITGALTLVSLFWFVRLPADAGDELTDRRRK